MQFRTEIKLAKSKLGISLKQDIVTTGSCFSDAIGLKLAENKFPVLINPFGTSYNPISIHKTLRAALNGALPLSHSYFEHGGIYSHYDFHSEFSHPEKAIVEEKVKSVIQTAHQFIKMHSGLLSRMAQPGFIKEMKLMISFLTATKCLHRILPKNC